MEFLNKAWAWVTAATIRWAGILAGIVLLIAVIIAIVVVAKKKKKAKNAKLAAQKVEAKPVKPAAPVAQAKPVVEEKPVEAKPAAEVVEAKAEPVAEPVAEVKDEPIAEETVEAKVEPKVEVKSEKKAAPKKKPAAKKATAAKPAKKMLGKWVIEFKQEKEFSAKLLAPNGEVMLNSEVYTTEEGVRSGIATIVSGVTNGKFVVYENKNGNYYYKLKTAGNRLLCVGEIYKTKDQCLKAVESVKRIAADAVVDDDVYMGAKYADYKPEPVQGYEVKKGLAGKWRVETTDEGKFTAKLYASNGQLMLATEEVSIRKNAEAAIESVKKNSLAGNFIIDQDKFGRFYFKLRNAQKTVICIGESYESLDSCVKALESVRRFAYTAAMPE